MKALRTTKRRRVKSLGKFIAGNVEEVEDNKSAEDFRTKVSRRKFVERMS